MEGRRWSGSLLAATALLLAPNASASPATRVHPPIETVFASLQRVRGFHDASISPDGQRAAWSRKVADRDGRDRLGAIMVAELPSGKPRRLSAATDGRPRRELEPVFSPDGRSIAFLSDAASPGQLQVYVETAPGAGGSGGTRPPPESTRPRAVTKVKGQLQELRWAPDGKSRSSFLFVEGSEQEPGATTAHKRDSGPVEENHDVQRIAVADLATGRVRSVSPEGLYVYDYDWSPDGNPSPRRRLRDRAPTTTGSRSSISWTPRRAPRARSGSRSSSSRALASRRTAGRSP